MIGYFDKDVVITREKLRRKRAQEFRALGMSRRGVKLCERDVRHIREFWARGYCRHTIAHWYGVSDIAVWQIVKGVTWGHVR